MEKISVIVPVYNVESLLPRCLDSILAQTYSELEIILVDDGSTDRSGQVCDEYARRDSRVCVIHQVNQGLGPARNNGLKVASGDLIGFVDSDDWIDPDMYEHLLLLLKGSDSDMAVCEFRKRVSACQTPLQTVCAEGAEAVELFKKPCWNANVWNKLFKRELVMKVSFRKEIHEDVRFLFLTTAYAKKIVFSNQSKYFYYVRPGSITNSGFNPSSMAWQTIFPKISDEFKEITGYPLIHDMNQFLFEFTVSRLHILISNAQEKVYPDIYHELWNSFKKYRKQKQWSLSSWKIRAEAYLLSYCSPVFYRFLFRLFKQISG